MKAGAFKRMAVAVDGSPASRAGVRYALSLAGRDTTLFFCSVVDPASDRAISNHSAERTSRKANLRSERLRTFDPEIIALIRADLAKAHDCSTRTLQSYYNVLEAGPFRRAEVRGRRERATKRRATELQGSRRASRQNLIRNP